MALLDEVENRIPESTLVQLTNNDDSSPSTVDEYRLILACNDIQAKFETLTGTPFDITDQHHVELCVIGVVVKLQMYIQKLTDKIRGLYKEWKDELEIYRKTLGTAQRVMPESSSHLEPLDEKHERHANFDNVLGHYLVMRPAGSQRRGRGDLGGMDRGVDFEIS